MLQYATHCMWLITVTASYTEVLSFTLFNLVFFFAFSIGQTDNLAMRVKFVSRDSWGGGGGGGGRVWCDSTVSL